VSRPPTTIYLEADDEVTSVVRRLRDADPGPIVLVAPGRSRATSSVVALRLLGRAAEADGRAISIVGDALTRSLAAEAGLPAYASLDDARAADGSATAPAAEPRHAAISVVRGPAADETAPTLAAATTAREPSGASPDDLTRPVPVAAPPRPARARRAARAPRRRRALPMGILAVAGLLVLAGAAAAVALLPAATVTITPRTDLIGPVSYEITVTDAERASGTVSATTEVVATGSYTIQEPASGTVVLFNWTFVPVDVEAGTLVAAGEQAFVTQVAVTVPRGRLVLPQGVIAAGEQPVAVVAAAPGPAGNVGAGEINVVLDESTDARLRGFPENEEPRVLNPEPTSGGIDTTGPEITQADVDAAVAALRAELAGLADDAVGSGDPERIVVEAPRGEPTLDIPEGLVGTRDQERVAISGDLAWEVVGADPAAVEDAARARLESDPTLVAAGQELLPDSVEVTVGEASLIDGTLVVAAEVTARSMARFDADDVRARIAGRSAEAAEAALADLGMARVELWPGWASTIPELEWRVEIRVSEAAEDGT